MQVLVNCDDPICCDSELIQRVEGVIAGKLERFGEHLSRVEVRLKDLHSDNPGDRDKVCSVEVRLAVGVAPVTIEQGAPTLAEAIHGAVMPARAAGGAPVARLFCPTQQFARQHALTPRTCEIRIRGSFSRRGTQAANGSRL